jgi:hypothetical protein
MFKVIWEFLTDKQTFMVAMKMAVSILAVAAVDGAFDGYIPEDWGWVVNLAYPIVGLTAATGKKKKENGA